MSYWLFTIPLASAVIGWIAGSSLIYYLIHNKLGKKGSAARSENIAATVSGWFPMQLMDEKLNPSALLSKHRPLLETHVDEFLNKKLKEEIPMLAMFITEKTTNKVKEVFMKQLETLFPKVMSEMMAGWDIKSAIAGVLTEKMEDRELSKLIYQNFATELRQFKWWAAIVGAMMGFINLLLFYIIAY